jgi:hypothetical protein
MVDSWLQKGQAKDFSSFARLTFFGAARFVFFLPIYGSQHPSSPSGTSFTPMMHINFYYAVQS